MILADLAVNAEADAVGDLLADGYLRLYDGAAPRSADDDVGRRDQMLLAEFRFAGVSRAEGGVIAAAPLVEPSARATGTPRWFRVFTADGATLLDGDADELEMPARIIQGELLEILSFAFVAQKRSPS